MSQRWLWRYARHCTINRLRPIWWEHDCSVTNTQSLIILILTKRTRLRTSCRGVWSKKAYMTTDSDITETHFNWRLWIYDQQDAGHSTECKLTLPFDRLKYVFCTLRPCDLDLWLFNLILNGWSRLSCDKFGDCSFSRLVLSSGQTDR